jgi:hypothetical protein
MAKKAAGADAAVVSLDQQLKRVKIGAFEIENPLVFEFFDKTPAAEREDALTRAIYIGVLALKEDRLAAFLAKTQNDLGTQLESLKLIFEMKREIFYKTATKGMAAEDKDLVSMQFNEEYLTKFLKDGTLTEKDYLDYFMASDLKDRFNALQLKPAVE